MREYDEYQKILELWESGMAKKRIAITLGIPRGTVIDCIKRYSSLKGLEEQKERASRSTSDEVLRRICDSQNAQVQKSYAYVLGIYLGDGYIVRNNRVYFLRIALDNRYPNLINFCVGNVQDLLPENRVNILQSRQGKFVEVICTYKFWPDILPQAGLGKKHNREIKLEAWQQVIVNAYPLECFRGLYHSDGSRFSNLVKGKDYPRYSFTNNSQGILQLFCYTCNLLGVHWTVKKRNSGRDHATDIFISRREDVAYLDSVVGAKS